MMVSLPLIDKRLPTYLAPQNAHRQAQGAISPIGRLCPSGRRLLEPKEPAASVGARLPQGTVPLLEEA